MPISFRSGNKREIRTQFAALCYRMVEGKPEILLITTRKSGRWLVPKGWPMDGKTPGESALIEAWEEAGVKGKVIEQSLGIFSYKKDIGDDDRVPCLAMVFPVKVKSLAKKYPESKQRLRRWMRPKKAATKINDPELAEIIKNFDPARWEKYEA